MRNSVRRLARAPRGVFKGRNLLTPMILGYYRAGPYYVELSQGRGLDGQPIYGVTVATRGGGTEFDLSRCVATAAEADRYIRELVAAPAPVESYGGTE